METVRYLVRLNASRRWRSLILLALVVGLTGSITTALAVGAQRTATAVTRLAAVSNSSSLLVFSFDRTPASAEVAKLPGVAAAIAVPFVSLPVDGVSALYQPLIVDNPAYGRTLENGPVVRGRMFDAASADEVVVDEKFTADSGLDVGDVIPVRLPTKAELLAVPQEERFPVAKRTGPVLSLTIVGVQRTPLLALDDQASGGNIVGTPALLKAHYDELTGGGVLPGAVIVWLEPGVSPEAFDARVVREGYAGSSSTGNGVDTALPAVRLQGSALLVVALVLGLASLLLLGLIISRLVRGYVADSRAMVAFGLTGRDRHAEALSWVGFAAVLGAVLTLAGAYALSTLFPVGLARWFDPEPGLKFDGWILVGGFTALIVTFSVGVVSTWRSIRRESKAQPLARAHGLWGFGLPLPSALATRGTFRPSPLERSSVSLIWVAAAIAAFGIVASATVASGIDSLSADGRVAGRTADLGLAIGADPVADADAVRQTRADPDVATVWEMRASIARLNGSTVNVLGPARDEAALPIVMLRGRAPESAGEVVLGPRTLARSGAAVGDRVRLDLGGSSQELRIVGTSLFDTNGGIAFDDGAYVDGGGYDAVFGDRVDQPYALVDLRPGVDVEAWRSAFTAATAVEFQDLDVPSQVANVTRIESTPKILALLLALLATIGAGVALLGHARVLGNQHAVLRSLGLRRRQSWGVLPQHAALVGFVAAVVLAPGGVVAGRWIWRGLCDAQNLLYRAPMPAGRISAALAAFALVLVLLSLMPSTALARINVSRTLRRE